MGQAAGTKRRKRRAGNYNLFKDRKGAHRRAAKNKMKGLSIVGLENSTGAQCLLTRLESGGLVSNLKKYSKPDKRMLIEESIKKVGNKSEPKPKSEHESVLAKKLEESRARAKERKLKYRNVVIPKPQIRLLSHYLDKYGEDYRAMTADPMNYDQLTWKQIRGKINCFKNSGAPFVEYLKDRGLLPPIQNKEDDNLTHDSEDEEDSSMEDSCEEELTAEEKLAQKIADMERAEKDLKRKLTAKRIRPKLVESESEDSEDDDDEVPVPGTGRKSNIKRKLRQKKAKVAKNKRVLKAMRTMKK